jgi:hypothetical protein
MRLRAFTVLATAAALLVAPARVASADNVDPGQGMTHMKTATGLLATLEQVGVVMYVQGGATASVMGESIGAPDGRMILHVPITSDGRVIKHQGSVFTLFNTTTGQQVQLQNPVINLKAGTVKATVRQADNATVTVFSLRNASQLKPKVKVEAGVRITEYVGARLTLAPGIAGTLTSLLGMPEGTLTDRAPFATADITLRSVA